MATHRKNGQIKKLIPAGEAGLIEPAENEATGETIPTPFHLPPVLKEKIKAAWEKKDAADREFNTAINAYVDGYMADKPPTPDGWRLMCDPSLGVIYFARKEEPGNAG